MFHYYKSTDEFFTHYYRVKSDEIDNGLGYTCLHVNADSLCINVGYFRKDREHTVVDEKEFNDLLEKTLDNLGVNLKKFKFV